MLIECGWYANDFIEKSYLQATEYACPNIKRLVLDGRDAEIRQLAWASADIFCSLSDNIQETFGITPIEAMAAGLPVLVSDWDGYKETVRDTVDGFRIPTIMPQPKLGGDLSVRHALGIDTYDTYCGLTCSFVAVDIEKATQAFVQLLTSKELRQQLGEAGRKHAIDTYDWKNIIPQYESLWAELNQIRKGNQPPKMLEYPWPARMDPFDGFASYATGKLNADTKLSLVIASPEKALDKINEILQLSMVAYVTKFLPTSQEMKYVLDALKNEPRNVLDLMQGVHPDRQSLVYRGLNWMLKVGVLKVIS